MTEETLSARLARAAYPRSSRYDPAWLLENLMGPHVLWLAEYLSAAMTLAPGMRVLDLGCGKALSAIFLAQEFDVTVFAADLWIKPTENRERIDAAGVRERVIPVYAEAHALPFAHGYFDAIVSLDAYHYFGTDDLYLGQIVPFLKPGGTLGIVCPGVREELSAIPERLKPYWESDFCTFHSPTWWRRHWEKTGLVDVTRADFMPDGRELWLSWNRLSAEAGPGRFRAGATREAEMLENDVDGVLGFTRAVARRK